MHVSSPFFTLIRYDFRLDDFYGKHLIKMKTLLTAFFDMHNFES